MRAKKSVRTHHLFWAVLIGAPALPACQTACATVFEADPASYRTALSRLGPGDVLQLAPGTYDRGLPLAGLSGTRSQPIVIRGPADLSALFRAQPCCNTIQLRSTSHVVIRDLTLDGRNLDGPFAVDSRGPCSDITLQNLRIVGHGASLQDVAISTKGPAWNWTIRGNTIIGAGTGLYLGNSDGTQPFVAGIIENNLILNTRGYNMEIKQQLSRPTDMGLPAGSSRTIIRRNVFSKSRLGATGTDARPNVLVGHFPRLGPGSEDRYEIYGNLFLENPDEALFQGEGNIALYDNIFVNSGGDAVNIRPQNDRPRTIAVFHNTVVARGRGISVLGGQPGAPEAIFANAAFAAAPIRGPNQSNNVTAPYSAAAQWLVAPLAALAQLDLHPNSARLAGPAMDPAVLRSFTDAMADFDGCPRAWRYRGAYDGPTPADSWHLALAHIPAPQRDLRHACERRAVSAIDPTASR